jgi:hypothetical protein
MLEDKTLSTVENPFPCLIAGSGHQANTVAAFAHQLVGLV